MPNNGAMRCWHFLIILLVLTGCGSHKPGLVGTWDGTRPLPGGGSTPVTLTLHDGGTFLSDSEGRGAGGSYTVTDGILSETFTLYVSGGVTHAIPPSSQHTERAEVRMDGDRLTLTPQEGGAPITLTRRKP